MTGLLGPGHGTRVYLTLVFVTLVHVTGDRKSRDRVTAPRIDTAPDAGTASDSAGHSLADKP